jgi:FSR family fosmidomycin resistance protein-like MFS transporter
MSAKAESNKSLKNAPWASMAILFFVHFVVDAQSTFFAPLIPLLREKFEFSLATAGVLISIQSITGSITQPITAIVIDRWPGMPWLAVGIICGSILFTSIGWVPVLAAVAVALPLGGFFFGLCHPDMGARAGRLSDAHSSLSVSIFVTGGRLGFALGPIIAITIANILGMEWLWIYVFIALVATMLVLWHLPNPPRPNGEPEQTTREKQGKTAIQGFRDAIHGQIAALRRVRKPISLLFGIAIVRGIITINLGGLLPTLFHELGHSLTMGALANSTLFLIGAVGVISGGILGDQFGKRITIIFGLSVSFLGLGGFLMFPYTFAPLTFAYFFLAIVGFGTFIPMGVSVALAQEYLPEHRGFASSLILGTGTLFASLTPIPIAAAAEHIGLIQALWIIPMFVAVGIISALLLPRDRPAPQSCTTF